MYYGHTIMRIGNEVCVKLDLDDSDPLSLMELDWLISDLKGIRKEMLNDYNPRHLPVIQQGFEFGQAWPDMKVILIHWVAGRY